MDWAMAMGWVWEKSRRCQPRQGRRQQPQLYTSRTHNHAPQDFNHNHHDSNNTNNKLHQPHWTTRATHTKSTITTWIHWVTSNSYNNYKHYNSGNKYNHQHQNNACSTGTLRCLLSSPPPPPIIDPATRISPIWWTRRSWGCLSSRGRCR